MLKKLKELLGEKEKEVPFSSLASWVEEEIDAERRALIVEASPITEDIGKGFSEVRSEVEEIRDVEKELFRRLSNITKTSQKKFCESILNVIGRVTLEKKDGEGISQFLGASIEALSDMRRMDQMHGKVLYFSFPEEMKGFRASVKSVALSVATMERIVSSHGERMTLLTKLKGKLSEIEANKKKIAQIEAEMEAMSREIQEEENRYERLSSELKTISESKEYAEHQARQRRRDAADNEIESIEGEINSRLSPLIRIFRKTLSEARHGKVKVNEALLSSYVESPLDTFLLEESGYPALKTLLSQILSVWDTIEEKDKKKIYSTLTSIHGGALEEFQRRRMHLLEETEKYKEDEPAIMAHLKRAREACEDSAMRKRDILSTSASLANEKKELEKRNEVIARLQEDALPLGIRIAE
jgi:hypothetical protein